MIAALTLGLCSDTTAWGNDADLVGDPFQSIIQGPTVRLESGTGVFGAELTSNLGVTSMGLVTVLDGRITLAWVGRGEATLGVLGDEWPVHALYGVRGEGSGIAALRLWPTHVWSPLIALNLASTASALDQSGASLTNGSGANNGGTLTGLLATGVARLGLGASLFHGRHSLLIAADALAELDSAQSYASAVALAGGGLSVRYNLRDALSVVGELALGAAPSSANVALGVVTHMTRWEFSTVLLKSFGERWFFGVDVELSREETTVAYSSGQRYVTDGPLDGRFGASAGYRL